MTMINVNDSSRQRKTYTHPRPSRVDIEKALPASHNEIRNEMCSLNENNRSLIE